MRKRIEDIFSYRFVYSLSILILGSIFLYSGLIKIFSISSFAKIVSNYKILPENFVSFFSYLLPIVEMIFAVFLILRIFPKFSALVLSVLLLTFIITIFSNIVRGINTDCGCFSKSASKEINNWHNWGNIFRDILFLIPGIYIIFFKEKK